MSAGAAVGRIAVQLVQGVGEGREHGLEVLDDGAAASWKVDHEALSDDAADSAADGGLGCFSRLTCIMAWEKPGRV